MEAKGSLKEIIKLSSWDQDITTSDHIIKYDNIAQNRGRFLFLSITPEEDIKEVRGELIFTARGENTGKTRGKALDVDVLVLKGAIG